jgi:predicted DNA-binding transcriptional regulator YafY
MILVADCHLRNDRRHFKLERIVRLHRIPLEPTARPTIMFDEQPATEPVPDATPHEDHPDPTRPPIGVVAAADRVTADDPGVVP